MLAQVPNILTLLRIAACPVLVILLNGQNYGAALLLFLVAGITDGLDGYIAKRYNFVSKLGAILDPIADKLLIASTYIMLAILQDIPFYLLIVVMFRDLVIVAGYLILVMMGENVPMRPLYTSKINTFLQITLMIAVLMAKAHLLAFPMLVEILIVGVVITTVVSGVQYVWSWGIRREYGEESG
ncbi:MAG: CDP-alcohol phosphatidyltransferase family protein [Pseudomonadota bacterium]